MYKYKIKMFWGKPLGTKTTLFTYFFLVAPIFMAGCSVENAIASSADWAISFVVWDDYIYRIGHGYVQEIDEEIGQIMLYSDTEGSYAGNFSNEYEKGTKYFSITGISTNKAIAIKEKDGKYRKAIRDGIYEGR